MFTQHPSDIWVLPSAMSDVSDVFRHHWIYTHWYINIAPHCVQSKRPCWFLCITHLQISLRHRATISSLDRINAVFQWDTVTTEARSVHVGNLDRYLGHVTYRRNLAVIGFATFSYVGKLNIYVNWTRLRSTGQHPTGSHSTNTNK